MDPELIQAVKDAQRGDRDGLAYLVSALTPQVKVMANKLVSDRQMAEDITQEALLLVCLHVSKLREGTALYGWLMALVRSAISRHWRKRRPEYVADVVLDASMDSKDNDNPEDLLVHGELKDLVRACVDSLGEKERVVIERYYLQGHSIEQTARELGLPTGTVKRRLYEARALMRSKISRHADTQDFFDSDKK